ncbi:hypothetical protein AB0N93_38010 [Streptomyces sp. NPDC091267]|uniref:hypothetical protein n=1 Tax=Streptomyces sp. NPDC091267 TaxID=3155195 RepID=UPI0034234DE4
MSVPAASDAGTDLLAIYLNDHLAGATAGLELFRRAAENQEVSHGDTTLADLAQQVEEDRGALTQIMTALGVSVDHSKATLGWLAEKAGRLKPNGHLFSRSPLSNVLELESMLLGVQGKAACWRTLRALAETEARLRPEDLAALLERAETQSSVLERMRLAASIRVFPSTPPSA